MTRGQVRTAAPADEADLLRASHSNVVSQPSWTTSTACAPTWSDVETRKDPAPPVGGRGSKQQSHWRGPATWDAPSSPAWSRSEAASTAARPSKQHRMRTRCGSRADTACGPEVRTAAASSAGGRPHPQPPCNAAAIGCGRGSRSRASGSTALGVRTPPLPLSRASGSGRSRSGAFSLARGLRPPPADSESSCSSVLKTQPARPSTPAAGSTASGASSPAGRRTADSSSPHRGSKGGELTPSRGR